MCFDAKTGEFEWQLVHDKLTQGRVNDWPNQGICSSPVIEDGKFYYVSNQCQVVCADLDGLADGNDGPYKDEKYTGAQHGDIIWIYDMIEELGVFPHNLATCSPLVVNDLVMVITANGVERDHKTIPAPRSPSFLACNKVTGDLVWDHNYPGEEILHGQWSTPAYGVAGGTPQVVFPGGDGWVYGLNPSDGEIIWKFDCNPKDSIWELGGLGTRNSLISTPVFYGDSVIIAVGQDPEHGEGIGNLFRIRADGKGDVTETHKVWSVGGDDFRRSISTAAVHDGLIYAADLSGFLYCFDFGTGSQYWRHDLLAAVWGSPTVIDGKVFIGDEDGDVLVCKTGKTYVELAEMNMDNSVYSTPVVAGGLLYVGQPDDALRDRSRQGRRGERLIDELSSSDDARFRGGHPRSAGGPRRMGPRGRRLSLRSCHRLRILARARIETRLGPASRSSALRRFEPLRRVRGRVAARRPRRALDSAGREGPTGVRVRDRRQHGHPEESHHIEDFRIDYSQFSETLPDEFFPKGSDWISIGPTGPRRLRLAVEHLAQVRGGMCFSVDMDPRWVVKSLKRGWTEEANAYKDHVIDQTLTLLRAHPNIRCLFATPKLLEALCEKISLRQAGITGVFCGGTQMNADFHRLAREELCGDHTAFVPTYGNTLMGLACHKPYVPEDDYEITYYPPHPRAVLQVVDPDDPKRELSYGERGRVKLTTLTKEFFVPGFLERDEAIRAEPIQLYPWDGVRDVRPFSRFQTKVVEGVY